ncbi:conserved hypothetical protein [Cupriavidus taiwanensis]|nr:conserved hypothetical protein [Cupriavidus taiwanensis]SOZ82582.1 conserved hypothetical protein [Cupriavidus taiwanensis]SOZ91023.1 conserved hypothetical protein [Cupriavidus taiwanensis]SPD40318.1 conserved protein of unknown function [Cupriavidus taiwanensis]
MRANQDVLVPGDHCDKLAHYRALPIHGQGRALTARLARYLILCMGRNAAIAPPAAPALCLRQSAPGAS